jgi:uncharacterized glyoxalase superfamily protein PhnB
MLGFAQSEVLRTPGATAVHGMASHGPVLVQFSPGGEAEARRGVGVTIYVMVGDEDIDGYYESVVQAGADVVEEIETQYWGDRSFTIADPDGFRVMFAKQVQNVSMEDMARAAAAGAT